MVTNSYAFNYLRSANDIGSNIIFLGTDMLYAAIELMYLQLLIN